MQKNKKIFVCAAWENDARIGTLFCDNLNGKEVFSFEYDDEWVRKHVGLLLDPQMRISPYRIYPNDKMLFGIFEDACPDRWGRKLMERREMYYAMQENRRPQKFMESDYLLGVQDECRSGGLRFSIDEKSFVSADDHFPTPPMTALRELEQVSLGYETGCDERWIKTLVSPGSSLGGARPKANVKDEKGYLWIAKFPSKNDEYDVGAWEKVTHDLARLCGINVPASRLVKISKYGSTFLVRRFDRDYTGGQERRVHYASAMTMLGARDGKTDGMGFLDLAETIPTITKNVDVNLKELFLRVAFDIAVSNHDDHFRNHGFLLRENSWNLAPAFDLNPVPGENFLSINIDMDDGYRSFDKLIETSVFYRITKDEANLLVKNIAKTVAASWKYLASKYGINEPGQRRMASAFQLSENEGMR